MTAVEIFKQSLSFYGQLFNKLLCLSIVSSITPLIMVGITSTGEPPNVVAIMFIAALSVFFSVYMMSLIHQFSVDQDDSLKNAFSLTLSKVLPVALTGFVFGLAVVLVIIPASFVATILGSGITDEMMRNIFMMVIIAIPLSVVMYRCFFAPYLTLVDGLSPIDAIKASNKQVKGNRTIFYGFTLLSFVVLAYVIVLVVLNLMIAVNPMALDVAEFLLNVIALPFFSVFIYRLFSVTKIKVEEISKDNENQ
jgi:hypothetical protein